MTINQVDQARTLLETRTRTVQQVVLNEAHVQTNRSHFEQSDADVEQRKAQRDQAANGIDYGSPIEPAEGTLRGDSDRTIGRG